MGGLGFCINACVIGNMRETKERKKESTQSGRKNTDANYSITESEILSPLPSFHSFSIYAVSAAAEVKLALLKNVG
jgi:hypothetical protein